MTTDSAQKAAAPAKATPRVLVPLLAGGMGLSMFILYTIGSLAPFVIADLHITKSELGLLTSAAFGTATVLSLFAGHFTDTFGARRAFILLSALIAVDFALVAAGHTYWLLLIAVLIAGIPQSLSNPSTNKLIAAHVPPAKRAFAIGVKQSGVPLAALIAGLALPSLARATSWRTAVLLVVPIAAAASLAAVALPRDQAGPPGKAFALPAPPNRATQWLMGYSLFIGAGLASLNTYLALYAHERLGLSSTEAGALISAIGVSGVASRLLWSRYANRMTDIPKSLLVLALTAIVFAALIPAATSGHWLVWAGAVGLGGSAAAANAVTMVAVTQGSGFGRTGHASGLVSMGFFAGFVLGPSAFGLLSDGRGGYRAGWILVAAEFALAVVAVWIGRRSIRSCA
ncbi:MFS transporter [Streptomyces sp. NBC_01198]|uniref:MFS transporter n=1 Tax=Streptomyces sp. NBC_01198 TaxID=2903769 RepID=UPI002E114BD4|nr:MFS transporter [Streptomyces sp. NBC_01198]